jgi:DNA-binding MarR family transcriptional regulator
MAAFQNTREQTEQTVMVQLLSQIEQNPSFTQRSLAGELNIALGLMNQYLKRCLTKGWIRASQVSARRITYFLTPEGFSEKSRMVKDYLARSMTFFRDARLQCEEVLSECTNKGWQRIALLGPGDLADIACLVAPKAQLKLTTVAIEEFNIHGYDAVVITDVIHPQAAYDQVRHLVAAERLFTLPLLHISR